MSSKVGDISVIRLEIRLDTDIGFTHDDLSERIHAVAEMRFNDIRLTFVPRYRVHRSVVFMVEIQALMDKVKAVELMNELQSRNVAIIRCVGVVFGKHHQMSIWIQVEICGILYWNKHVSNLALSAILR